MNGLYLLIDTIRILIDPRLSAHFVDFLLL